MFLSRSTAQTPIQTAWLRCAWLGMATALLWLVLLGPAWLIGGRVQLSGLVIFISVLGGIGAFGVLGIVLGPIIVATTSSVLALYTHPELSRHARGKAVRP